MEIAGPPLTHTSPCSSTRMVCEPVRLPSGSGVFWNSVNCLVAGLRCAMRPSAASVNQTVPSAAGMTE